MLEHRWAASVIIDGAAEGEVLLLEQAISFWGGIDPDTGLVIDQHHPQHAASVKGRILVLPGTRGSTAGPGAILETLRAGNGPAAVILTRPDVATVVGITAADWIGVSTIPLVELSVDKSFTVATGEQLRIVGGVITRLYST